MHVQSRWETPEDPHSPHRPDTAGTRAWWLLTEDTVGAKALVMNICELPPRTAHQLHRHANAEQAVIVISGQGLHLQADSAPIIVGVGEVVHIPAGEWHGFANPFSQTVTIATVYGGVARREQAGYELHPGDPFDYDGYFEESAPHGRA